MADDVWSMIRKSKSVMGEVMTNHHDLKADIARLNNKYKKNIYKRHDLKMKVCEECNMVWEPEFGNYHRKVKKIIRYSEIPKYKKPRKTCPICLGDDRYEE